MPRLNFFPYMGGKSFMVKDILSIMPEHTTYIEVFGGAGNVLLNKPPSKVEIYNDYDETIYIVWRTMKEKGNEVIENLKGYIMHERIHKDIIQDWKKGYRGKDDIDITCRFLFLTHTSFLGGLSEKFDLSIRRNKAKQLFNKVYIHYNNLIQRLQNVQILNKDFRVLLEKIVKPNASDDIVLYLDPPYIGTEKYYNPNFTLKDHQDLADILSNIGVKFILSYYRHDLLKDLYPENKFNIIDVERFKTSTARNKNGDKLGKEILITNF